MFGAPPICVAPLWVKPAVYLHVTQIDRRIAKIIPNLEKCLGVPQLRLETVIVFGTVIGPITQILEPKVGIVWRPLLSSQVGEKTTPGLERAVDAGCDDQHGGVNIGRWYSCLATDSLTVYLAVRATSQ
jgi:hypothetical protein